MGNIDTSKGAATLLVLATTELVWIGGREAAAKALETLALKVRQGEYPEPLHPAGTA